VLAEHVDVGIKGNICQADVVDGEWSSSHVASAGGWDPQNGKRVLICLFRLGCKNEIAVTYQGLNLLVVG
jgi:hypothetical protein